jgi:hypothetical protein
MITHHLTNKVKTIRGFNRFSKFLVIGNNIDGYISIGLEEFKNWEDFKKRFPDMYRKITFQGEWSLNIYQVPDDYKIKLNHGYYKIPNKGKMIADIGYMEIAGKQLDVVITNGIMHFQSRTIDGTENWDPEYKSDQDSNDAIDFLETEVYEDFLTIILKEDLDYKTFKDEVYPGNAGAIHHEIYTQVY